ncbi:hypothetical protein GW17_00021808 [Ensete ventricosum]|nr:hypothetical protein GW17_00021808 [Ensete ventricosum]
MAAGRDAVLPAEKPADRGPGNQQGQRPTQDRTCKSTEGPLRNIVDRPAPTANTPTHSLPELDTLSSDSIDSLRAQLCLMNRRLDEVQKEFVKSKEELEESSTARSPFVPG